MRALKVIFVLGLLTLSSNVFAQPASGPPLGGNPPAGGPPPCWPPPCIPIDGGVGFLVAAGLAFGGKKAFDASRKQKENENDEGAA